MKIVLLSLLLQASLAEIRVAQYGSCVNETAHDLDPLSGYHCHFDGSLCAEGEVWHTPAQTADKDIKCTCDDDYNDNVFVASCYNGSGNHEVVCAATQSECPEGWYKMGPRYNSHHAVDDECGHGTESYGAFGAVVSCGKQCRCNFEYKSRENPVEIGTTPYGKCYNPATNLQFCAATESVCAANEEYFGPHSAAFSGPECNCDRAHTGACVTVPSPGEFTFGHCGVAEDSCNAGESYLTATALKASGLAIDCRLCDSTWAAPTVSPAPTVAVTALPTTSPTLSHVPTLSHAPTNSPTESPKTPAPTAAATLVPTAVPTAADTAKPSESPIAPPKAACIDNKKWRYKGEKRKSCIWVSKLELRTENLCKKPGVKRNCKIVCGTCCGDSKDKFKIGQKPNQEKKGCNYLKYSPERRPNLCPRKDVNSKCAETCGRCCSNIPGFEVVIDSGATKTCRWLAGKPARKRYCEKSSISTGCARVCGCADYTVKQTGVPVTDPTKAPVPAPTPVPTLAPVRAPVSLDDD